MAGQVYFVSFIINRVELPGVYAVLEHNGLFFIEDSDLQRLGLTAPDAHTISYRDRSFIDLGSVPSLEYRFEVRQLAMHAACSPACFPGTELVAGTTYNEPDETPTGAFLNYDLLAEEGDNEDYVSGLFEAGFFSELGTGELSFSGSSFKEGSKVIRLDTNWTIERPRRRLKIRLGDSVTTGGTLARPVRFAGMQIGTDFDLQPGFITFPTPIISGETSLPSTADVYVNGIRRAQLDVPAGPFTIEQLPIITGSGNLQVVLRDLLGRETVVVEPFYTNSRLLKTGLAEFALETGWQRNNYGLRSNDYDSPFAAGSYRRGISRNTTIGFHAEVTDGRSNAGTELVWNTPIGIVSPAVSYSSSSGRDGTLYQLGYEWRSERLGLQFFHEKISSGFRRLGTSESRGESRRRTSANVGFSLHPRGSLSFNYTRIEDQEKRKFEVASANYAVQVSGLGAISINVSYDLAEENGTVALLNFTRQLGTRTTAGITLEHDEENWEKTGRLRHNAPFDGGLGYSLEVNRGVFDRERAGLTYNTTRGLYGVEFSRIRDKEATRASARGGIAFLDGGAYLANPIANSFALVKAGDFENVGVLLENRRVAQTNAAGRALITDLRAYEKNTISIEPLDLPMSTRFADTSLARVPRSRSGTIVDFNVQREIAALVTIVDESGRHLPAGSTVRRLTDDAEFPVGFGGKAYLSGLDRPQRFEVRLPGQTCGFQTRALHDDTETPGILECKEQEPR